MVEASNGGRGRRGAFVCSLMIHRPAVMMRKNDRAITSLCYAKGSEEGKARGSWQGRE